MTVPQPEVDRAICETLAQWGIGYARFDHPPVFTCAEADLHVPSAADALQTKNLFLRDKKGTRHWLVINSCEKRVDIRALGEQLGVGRLSFGSPERLVKYLGVTPGAVTLLALAHHGASDVELVIDEAARGVPWRCHPMVNTATLVLDPAACAAFLTRTGHQPNYQAIPELDASGN
jgi:Ala-tRNA(Pro) deacylase